VRVYRLELLRYEYPRLHLEVTCGKGTYVRSLARDLGERLGCGALVEMLRRTHIGPFAESEAVTLDDGPELARRRLLPLAQAVLELPRVVLEPAALGALRNGQAVPWRWEEEPQPLAPDAEVAVFDAAGRLAGVGRWDAANARLRPDKMLAEV
jgi:tRNA pseudouridine55 synthase